MVCGSPFHSRPSLRTLRAIGAEAPCLPAGVSAQRIGLDIDPVNDQYIKQSWVAGPMAHLIYRSVAYKPALNVANYDAIG